MPEVIIILSTLIIDQLIKIWSAGPLVALHGGAIDIIPGVFQLCYVENRGAAFGMLQNKIWFFIVLTIAAILVMSYILIFKRDKLNVWLKIALAFMISGALGNFIDRVVLGYVRDMFDFYFINFAVFNIADVCLNVSIVLCVIGFIVMEKKEKEQRTQL